MKGRIFEVFDSIQGEGIYLGEKQIFVRFFGCNLSCSFCDTRINRFIEYDPQELFEEIILYHDDYHSISFTGGEPLLQKDFLKEVLKLTCANSYRNYLETNGMLVAELADVINYLDIIAMDLKLPSSTAMGDLWNFHRRFLKVASQKEVFAKVIICSSTSASDINQAVDLIKEISPATTLVLQPNSNEDYSVIQQKLDVYQKICLEAGVATCIIPQMHKIMGFR